MGRDQRRCLGSARMVARAVLLLSLPDVLDAYRRPVDPPATSFNSHMYHWSACISTEISTTPPLHACEATRRDETLGKAPGAGHQMRVFFHCTTKCIDRTHARGVCTMVSVSTAACMHAADRSMPPYSVRIAACARDGKLLATSHSLFLKNSAMSLRLRCSDLFNHGIL
jgi:hypothetical protein